MKARVIETNEIEELQYDPNRNYFTKDGVLFKEFELDFNVEQPDYWEKLKHQYAGMAMQGMFANPAFKDVDIEFVVLGAVGAATELIKKLKEEEK